MRGGPAASKRSSYSVSGFWILTYVRSPFFPFPLLGWAAGAALGTGTGSAGAATGTTGAVGEATDGVGATGGVTMTP